MYVCVFVLHHQFCCRCSMTVKTFCCIYFYSICASNNNDVSLHLVFVKVIDQIGHHDRFLMNYHCQQYPAQVDSY